MTADVDFTWRDGERLIRFGDGVVSEATGLVRGAGFEGYLLLTTERARKGAPALAEEAAGVLLVPAGRVDEVSGALLAEAGEQPLVALGGGRVIDVAKAIAGVRDGRCAAVPTTLSGAEMTPFHRLPAGTEGGRPVRPALVVADPVLMSSQPGPALAASAMNALAHAMEALYTPLANPVGSAAALRASKAIADGVTRDPPGRDELALGALLAGYASGAAGFAVHHAVCQTIVRTAGSPHAETNAVMLPHSARLMANRAPAEMGAFAQAVGDPDRDAAAADGRVAKLAARCGHVRLRTLGVGRDHVDAVVAAVLRHPALANTPDPPDEGELADLVAGAI